MIMRPVATSVRRDNVLSRFAQVISSAASAIAEVLVRASRFAWRWFGRTGRLWITVAGALAISAFVFSNLDVRGPSDTARQQQIKAVWRQVHATKGAESNAARTTVPAEVAAWLETTQTDLEQELRAHPVSGSASGSPRQKALARREMLFDVRDMRQYLASPSPLLATHIEKSLEAALNALSATKPERRAVSPATPAGDRGASSAGLKAMLVVNALLLILVVVWWLWRRSR